MTQDNGSKRAASLAVEEPPSKATKLSFASLPPPAATVEDFASDEEVISDEDARFLEGGISAEQAEAIDFVNQQGDNDEEEPVAPSVIDVTLVKRRITSTRKALNKNAKHRARFSDDPSRFMESEAELDTEVRQLDFLSEAPHLYPVALEAGIAELCAELLGHENTDIACAAVEVLNSCLDENVQSSEKEMEQLLKGLEAADVLPSLVQNLARLDEQVAHEQQAYYDTLLILENICNLDNAFKRKLAEATRIMSVLVARIHRKEAKSALDVAQNKQYAAELLSLIVSDTASPSIAVQCIQMQGLETILLCLAPYRKKHPVKMSFDEEFLENCFDVLCRLVSLPAGKDDFLEQEGVGLMERLMTDPKAAKQAKRRAAEVLDFACGSWQGGAVCAAVVQAGLLKHLFATFTKKPEPAMLRNLLSLFASFFRTLNPGDPERIRVLNKFGEKQHAKLIQLVGVHVQLFAQRQEVQAKIVQAEAARSEKLSVVERQEYDLVNLLSLMNEGGLDALQLCDIVLAWLSVEDVEMNNIIVAELAKASLTSATVIQTLREMSTGLEDVVKEAISDQDEEVADRVREAKEERDMVEILADALERASATT